jgi:hypothetical protein
MAGVIRSGRSDASHFESVSALSIEIGGRRSKSRAYRTLFTIFTIHSLNSGQLQ